MGILLISLLHLFFYCLSDGQSNQTSNINHFVRHQFAINKYLSEKTASFGDAFVNTLPKQPESEQDYLEVEVLLKFVRIVKIHVEQQSMTFHCEVKLKWTDVNLSWSPDLYGNVTETKIKSTKIWTPDITIHNMLSITMLSPLGVNMADLYHDGTVQMGYSMICTIPCDANAKDFPFDTHHCMMAVRSWTHTSDRLQLTIPTKEKTMLFNRNKHPEWHLEQFNLSIIGNKEEDAGMYSEILATFNIRRNAAFFAIVLILPGCILNFLSILIFCLPFDQDDPRLTLGLNIIISYFVLLTIMVESMPSSGNSVPALGIYFSSSTMIVSMCVALSLIISKLNNNGEEGRKVYKSLLWILSVKCKLRKHKTKNSQNNNRTSYENDDEDDDFDVDGTMCINQKTDPSFNYNTIKQQRKKDWLTICDFINCLCAVMAVLSHVLSLAMLITIMAKNATF